MADAPPALGADEALAWEAAQRTRAGVASIAAGVLLLATFVYAYVGFDDSPNVVLTDGFRDALGQPLPGGRKGLLTESAMWFDDHALELLVVTALAAIGTVLIAFVLGYLFRATQARRPQTSRLILYAALIGPIFFGMGPLISAVSGVVQAGSYVSDGRFSTLGAHDALRRGAGITIAQSFVGLGVLVTALGVVFVSLNAMRVGLLTRFMGFLGCIVGVLLILPTIFGPSAIVQGVWLIALGLVVLDRGLTAPPAWTTGHAEPWPSQQQLREGRERGTDADPEPRHASDDGDDEQDTAADAFGTPHSSSKKRKRKRR